MRVIPGRTANKCTVGGAAFLAFMALVAGADLEPDQAGDVGVRLRLEK